MGRGVEHGHLVRLDHTLLPAAASPGSASPPWVQATWPLRLPASCQFIISCSATTLKNTVAGRRSRCSVSTRWITRGIETGLPIMAAWATLGRTVDRDEFAAGRVGLEIKR